jgi:hypothetical protein
MLISYGILQEIRYFKADGKLSYIIETAKAAMGSEAASGGKMVIIDSEEINAATKLYAHNK